MRELFKKLLSFYYWLYLLFLGKRSLVKEKVNSIIFVVMSPTGIGDLLMITPAIKAVRKAFPGARISLLTDKDLLRGNPDLDEIFLVRNYWEALGHTQRYDLVILPCKNLKASPLAFRLRRNYIIIGYLHNWKVAGNVKGLKGIFDVKSTHLYDMANNVVRNFGVEPVNVLEPIHYSEQELSKIKELIHYQPTDKLVVVCPYSLWTSRGWSLYSYKEIIRRLLYKGCKVVVNGGKNDLKDSLTFSQLSVDNNFYDLTGIINLYEFSALSSLAKLVITNDSGPMHISISMGSKVVSLWGPTNPQRRLPKNYWDDAICVEDEPKDSYFFEHQPRGYDKMKYISVDEVMLKTEKYINKLCNTDK